MRTTSHGRAIGAIMVNYRAPVVAQMHGLRGGRVMTRGA